MAHDRGQESGGSYKEIARSCKESTTSCERIAGPYKEIASS